MEKYNKLSELIGKDFNFMIHEIILDIIYTSIHISEKYPRSAIIIITNHNKYLLYNPLNGNLVLDNLSEFMNPNGIWINPSHGSFVEKNLWLRIRVAITENEVVDPPIAIQEIDSDNEVPLWSR